MTLVRKSILTFIAANLGFSDPSPVVAATALHCDGSERPEDAARGPDGKTIGLTTTRGWCASGLARLTSALRKASLIGVAAVLAAGDATARAAPPEQPQAQSLRDGQHDFDWEFGTWTTRVQVLRNPLSGKAPDWAAYEGTSVVRPVAGGRFNLVELSVAGAAGTIEGASLRLYNPKTRRWSLNYANVRSGTLTAPVEGNFDGQGRGVFLANDTLDGRAILVRFVITETSKSEAHFEQAFSADGGKTWETNWIAVDNLR